MADRDQNVTRDGGAVLRGTPPLRQGPGQGNQASRRASHATPASRARDYTPSPGVVLETESRRRAENVGPINKAMEKDPFSAASLSFEYLMGVLRKASRKNLPAGFGWCWAVVNVLDALAVTIDGGDLPEPWFRDHRNWRLNPAGWAPLAPVAALYRRLNREEGTR